MEDKKSCETCLWCSRDGYCTHNGKPPERHKEACERYEAQKNIVC